MIYYMKTIAICGNIILDSVYETGTITKDDHAVQCSVYSESLGGVVNVARTLHRCDPTYNVLCCGAVHRDDYTDIFMRLMDMGLNSELQQCNQHTSRATILSFNALAAKQSMVFWGGCLEYRPEARHADWHHIAYLDAVPNITKEFILACREEGVVSADLCIGKYTDNERERLLALMSEIDYVFMSDHEADQLLLQGLHNVAKHATIIHRSNGSSVLMGNGIYSLGASAAQNVNVLGAGDVFAAYCINGLVRDHDLLVTVADSHKLTKEFLCSIS